MLHDRIVAARVSALTRTPSFRFVCEQRFRSSGAIPSHLWRRTRGFNGLNTNLPPFPSGRPIQNRLQHPIWIPVAPPSGRHNWGGFPAFFQFDRNTKIPMPSFSTWHSAELPGNLLLEATYGKRMGRRLLAVGDAGTITNFKDTASGQFLRPAFGQLQRQASRAQHFKLDSRYSMVRESDQRGNCGEFRSWRDLCQLWIRELCHPHWSYLQPACFQGRPVRHHSGSFIDSRRDYCIPTLAYQHRPPPTDTSALRGFELQRFARQLAQANLTWIAIYV